VYSPSKKALSTGQTDVHNVVAANK